MTYRFAVAGFWGAVAFAGIDVGGDKRVRAEEQLGPPFSMGVIKGIILRNIRSFTQKDEMYTGTGALSIGWSYPSTFMSEVGAFSLPRLNAGLQLPTITVLGSQVFHCPRPSRGARLLASKRRTVSRPTAEGTLLDREALDAGFLPRSGSHILSQLWTVRGLGIPSDG